MTLRIIAFATLLLTIGFTPGQAHSYKAGHLEIGHPWARASRGASVAVGYLHVTNNGATEDYLTGVSSVVSPRAEIHTTEIVDGVARMRHAGAAGIKIAAGETLELKPGGAHIMFIDLTRPIANGESFNGTVSFKIAGSVTVKFSAKPPGDKTLVHAHH